MKRLNKKIVIITGIVLIILLVLMFPKVDELNDGGTKIYKSLTYEITKVHKIKEDSISEFYDGTVVKIFGKEVYNDLTKNVKIIVDDKESITTNKRYEKNIDDITLSLAIPNDWKYEELERNTENDFYKYALKIYKDNEDKYAVLYYYQQMLGVCGTGRTSKQIELENGIKASIGYYYEKDIWEDISFCETNKSIAIINYGLDKEESEEVINFVKTINITENSNKKENISLLLNEENLTSRNATFILKNDSTYDYKNPIIPEGFKSVETESASWKLDEEGNPTGWDKGLVIEDDIGNQFVWIPVKDTDNLKRKDGFYANKEQNYVDSCKEADDNNSTVESEELYKSIKRYKGFYIARYEAGIEDQLKTHIQDGTIKPISKQNVNVWNKIRWGSAYGYAIDGVQGNDREDGAVKVARSMYPNTEKLKTYYLPNDLTNDTGVISTLCYGVQWDLVMEFLNDIDNPYTKTKYVENSSNMGWYGTTTLQLTGTNLNGNNSNCVKNIYDLAGNVHEWTMESYKDNYRIYRGGVYDAGDKDFSASTRGHCVPNGMGNNMYVGFRVALYLK